MESVTRNVRVTISARTITKIFLVWTALSVVFALIYLARQAIGLIVISIFLAIALGPAVDFFQRRARIARWLSILVVYLLLALAVTLVALLLLPPIVTGVQELADEIPVQIDNLQDTGWIQELNQNYDVIDRLNESASELPAQLGTAAGTLQSIALGAFSAFVQIVSVLTLMFLWLLEGPRIFRWVAGQIPDEHRERAERFGDDIYGVVSGYVLGNLLISVAAGTVTYLTLKLLGVPFAAPLAIFMAFMDLIPLIGATIGGTIVAIVAAVLGDFPWDPVIWGIVLTAYQQVENNMLQPLIYRRTVAVPPLLTISAVLVGAALLGVVGVLLAIPFAAMLLVVARDLWPEWQARRAARATTPANVTDTV